MVSSTLGAVFIVSGLLEIVIPLILGHYLTRRLGTSWKTWIVGAVMLIVSLVRLPLNSYLSRLVLNESMGSLSYILMILVPSLTAGIFEETARYLGFKYIIKDNTYENGLTYGAGHGGIESILLVGFNVLSVGFLILMNPNVLSPILLDALLVTPAYLPLIGLYERIMAMIAQIGFSFMVMEFIKKDDVRYFVAAIGLHAFFDYLAVAVVNYSILASEILVTGFALGLGYWTYNKVRAEGILG
jgi:uncharacterized membrane protein YhfC